MQRILEALRQMLAGLVNIFAWPGRVLTNLFGFNKRDEEDAQGKAAGRAVSTAQKEEAEENRDALLRRQARALARVMESRLAGETPSKTALAKLPEAVLSYVMALTDEEVAVAARAPRTALIDAVVGEGIPGIRSPSEVRQDAAAARRAALEVVENPRATALGAKLKPGEAPNLKPGPRDVDAILADMNLSSKRMGM